MRHRFEMQEEFEADASSILLPQFLMDVGASLFSEHEKALVSREALTDGFTLADKDIQINFVISETDMAKIDIDSGSRPRSYVLREREALRFKEAFHDEPPEYKRSMLSHNLYYKMNRLDYIASEDLKAYILRIVNNMSNEELEKAELQLNDMSAERDRLNASLAETQKQIGTLNADVADKTSQIEMLNADVAGKASQIDTLNADIADKAAQIETLNADADTLKKAREDSEFRASELKKLFMKTFAASSPNTMANLEGNENVEVIRRFRIRDDDNPNVRSAPYVADDNKVGNARASQEYTILDVSENGWYLIRLDSGEKAWVSGRMGTVVEIEFNFTFDEQDEAAEGAE